MSKDLVHWQETDAALTADAEHCMASGSAVVDWKNTGGFGKDGQPPVVLFYTQVGGNPPTAQSIAHSTDGRTFTPYSGNPVLPQITPGNRDPKVFWHGPSGKWIMCLYVGQPDASGQMHDRRGLPANETTIQFFSSPDLKNWTYMSRIEGFFECPDLFELPMDGDAENKKWVLTAGNSDYMIGIFDGAAFKPESEIQKGIQGSGYYAGQTFSDVPEEDGRRVQIGCVQTAVSPGMPFNVAMSLPMELQLRNTPEGIRMTRMPVKELQTLRKNTYPLAPLTLKPGDANPLAEVKGELLELRADFEPGTAETVVFNVRGATVVYDAKNQELDVNGLSAPAPLINGKQRLVIYADRTLLEVFASDGLTYVPVSFIPKPDNRDSSLSVTGGSATISSLEAYELAPAWH